ncbi:hypothetical protein B5X24_HaOG205406 [Helicoverpa armigera]|nr:hypothetical protein B5X24_HaOG205406 [Helicoverpa armigera]
MFSIYPSSWPLIPLAASYDTHERKMGGPILIRDRHKSPIYLLLLHIYADNNGFIRLIFKRSKHSNIVSPIESSDALAANPSLLYADLSNNQEEKKDPVIEPESESC